MLLSPQRILVSLFQEARLAFLTLYIFSQVSPPPDDLRTTPPLEAPHPITQRPVAPITWDTLTEQCSACCTWIPRILSASNFRDGRPLCRGEGSTLPHSGGAWAGGGPLSTDPRDCECPSHEKWPCGLVTARSACGGPGRDGASLAPGGPARGGVGSSPARHGAACFWSKHNVPSGPRLGV